MCCYIVLCKLLTIGTLLYRDGIKSPKSEPTVESTALEEKENSQIVASSSTTSASNQNQATASNKQQKEPEVQSQHKKASSTIQGDLRRHISISKSQ